MGSSIKKNESEKNQNDSKFYSIFENSINGIILGKPDGSILEANTAIIDMFGYTLDEIKKLGRQGLFDMNDSRMSSAVSTREKKGKINGVLIGIRKNGERFPCEFSSVIFKNENEENRTSTILTDVTERKKAEEEIQLLLNNTEESFVLVDEKLRILSFNKQFKDGYKRLLNKTISKGDYIIDYAQEHRKFFLLELYAKVLKGETITDDIHIPVKKGEEQIFSNTYKPAYDHSNQIIGAFITSRNITSNRKTEQLAIAMEKRFQAVIEHANDILTLTDEKGLITYISPSLEKIIGKSLHEVKNTSYELLIHPDDRFTSQQILNTLLKNPNTPLPNTVRILTKNGSCVWVEGVKTNLLSNTHVNAIVSNCRDITEKQIAQKQLKQNHEQLIKLTENVDTIVYQFEISVDGKMTFPFISKGIHQIVPNIDIELLKEDASEAFSTLHPDDLPTLLASIEESRKNLTNWSFECRSIAFKDKITWIKGASHPNKKEDGTIVWYGYFLDITDRKLSEEKLKRSKERYDIIAKATNDTIWDVNLITNKTFWSSGIKDTYGYDYRHSDLSESDWWYSKIHPNDLTRVQLSMADCLINKKSRWECEYRFMCADGTYKYIYDRGFLVMDDNGIPIRMIGAMQDITNQKQEEFHLKLLESVIINMTNSVVITEPDAKTGDQIIVFVNDPFIKMTGYSIEELIGNSPKMFQGINSDRKELDKIRKAIVTYQKYQTEIINYKKNGEEYWINISISPVKNELGKPTHFIAIEKDVTERKLREIEREHIIAELSQNNKDLKQFSYVTSHNLRAPIANLLGLTTLLDQYKITSKSLKQILDGIRQSALIFDDTVKDLTKVLIIKDQTNIVKEKISLTEITNKVLSQLSITVDDNEVKVNYNFKESPFVNFTNTYLESVLVNLFTNSIKYKSPKRKLKINISSIDSNDFVILTFNDNGIGIDTELHKEKLFKLYQRFHDNPDGKGLGLYLIKSQIEALGSTIDIESKVDVGTTFIIKFKK